MGSANSKFSFLPYQQRWLADKSRFKIIEKSRRVGFTYVQSYEDVRDAARAVGGMDVWFSSADESAAKEYIRYCETWAKLYNEAASYLGEVVIDKNDDIKALVIEFSSGHRIHALSSNPKAFRSKGGKLVLDEFAFHAQPDEMWKAAAPILTWGYPVRVLSTYNGKGNRYARMVADARKPGSKWHIHTVTIEDAVADGLVDKILGRPATKADKATFLQDCREIAGDEETYQQEYMCVPVDEASAWLPWDLITTCEDANAGKPELYQGGPVWIGKDVAVRGDMAPLWVWELVGDVMWCREIDVLQRANFDEQEAALVRMMEQYQVKRVCMDQTGMGEKPVFDAQKLFGTGRIEGVLFSGTGVKQDIAIRVKQAFEDRKVRIPPDRVVRESLHSLRRMTTASGAPRFDADRTEIGHADLFWAAGLGLLAHDGTPVVPFDYISAGKRRATFGKGAW